MTPSQAFGVVVRSFGLIGWLAAIFYGISAGLALIWPDYRAGFGPWWHYVIAGVEFFAIGTVLLLGADRIVAYAYRGHPPSSSDPK
jgi:hypothetical protein